MRKYFIIISLIILVTVMILWIRKSAYHQYHTAQINGKIYSVQGYRYYVSLSIKGKDYRIIPNSFNGSPRLVDIAFKGDSVSKPANDDTLTLHRNGNQYQYTVGKW